MTRAPQKLIFGPPNYFQQFFKSSSLMQLQIKQKFWSTSNPTSQPKIPNQTRFFSFKLKTLPDPPNPKFEIPNKKNKKKTKGIFNPHCLKKKRKK